MPPHSALLHNRSQATLLWAINEKYILSSQARFMFQLFLITYKEETMEKLTGLLQKKNKKQVFTFKNLLLSYFLFSLHLYVSMKHQEFLRYSCLLFIISNKCTQVFLFFFQKIIKYRVILKFELSDLTKSAFELILKLCNIIELFQFIMSRIFSPTQNLRDKNIT